MNQFSDGGSEPDLESAPVLLPRTELFRLPPEGVGTPQQESLLSFLVRTCQAHAVGPRQLVRKVIAENSPAVARVLSVPFFRRLGGTVNGLGPYAELFVSTIEQQTGHTSLRHLTMLPWQDLFPLNGQGLLARNLRWCPVCLHEAVRQGGIVAFPLAWSLEAYAVCGVHSVPLKDRCPHCGKVQPFLPCYPDLAACDHCGGSLACARDGGSVSQSAFLSWVAAAVADMVAHHPEPGFAPSIVRFRDFVREQVAATTGGNRAAFCRMLGMNSHALNGWLNKGERPSITQFLTVCYGMGIVPAEVFGIWRRPLVAAAVRRPPSKLRPRRGLPRLATDRRKEVKRHLCALLATDDHRPVSAVGRELGLGPSCLRYWFPDLCRQLSDRHRIAVKERSAAHCERQQAAVRAAIAKIKAEGEYPSRRRVNRWLRPEGMSLAQPHLLEAYLKAVRGP